MESGELLVGQESRSGSSKVFTERSPKYRLRSNSLSFFTARWDEKLFALPSDMPPATIRVSAPLREPERI